ncbi:peptidase M23 [Vulcanibacillus modesticaldus]|uniref:Peptidase M23 n=1 Tax=Vulcanibacillus modesticaldus TaxID=337097 RepID=A0A1D2YUT5_9BACI|nr:peptidase M23 [Vulcanibacillus modesticaldus]
MKNFFTILLILTIIISFPLLNVNAREGEQQNIYRIRMGLFKNIETIYQIPWYYLAAIDQFERSIQPVRKDIPEKKGLIAIYFTKEKWAGLLHPDPDDQNPGRIQFFNGFGVDGNGDGKANRDDDLDVLVAFSNFLLRYGTTEQAIINGLKEYYNEQSAKIILEMAAIYKNYNRLDLTGRVFPIPRWFNYSYQSTWGDTRGWGGIRIHEGTDIFSSYGTPVRSVSHGYVEVLGWNKYGGWRVGIRGLNNIYYYYAHLSSFKKGLKVGDIVKPGDIIGYVGSSGYGPPGTQGKFPPHLHFGMYKYNGRYEWSFDPTPYLRLWEKNQYSKR